jgi:hypothetical protein
VVKLSARQIIGEERLSLRSSEHFDKLVAAVDACGANKVELDLTEIDIESIWKSPKFYELAQRENITLVVDAATADMLHGFLSITGGTANFVVKEQNIIPNAVVDAVQERMNKYLDAVKCLTTLKGDKALYLRVLDGGYPTLSSIGPAGAALKRVVLKLPDLIKERGVQNGVVFDCAGVSFEGGVDLEVAKVFVEHKKNGMSVKVLGNEGMTVYIDVDGRARLSTREQADIFAQLPKDIVCRFAIFDSRKRVDIAGQKDAGVATRVVIAIYRGVADNEVVFDEVMTAGLFTKEDSERFSAGENTDYGANSEIIFEKRIPLTSVGIAGVCTGSLGRFEPLRDDVLQLVVCCKHTYCALCNDVSSRGARKITETEFVRRGLINAGIKFSGFLGLRGVVLPK